MFKPPQRLEMVTVCIDYADFLAETLPWNMRQFDHVIVVTSHEDAATRDLCQHLGVECRPTDLHKYDGNFAKARAIDFGLAYLRGDGWIVHMDSDIWLPPMTRNWIGWAMPDPACIYGIDRFNCPSYEAWRKFLASPRESSHVQHIRHCLLVPPPFPMGARISIRDYGGYLPIGFFQLWHGSSGRRYPLQHGSAERTDVLHAMQWPLGQRRKMAELFCVHLDSNKGRMGANWNGRRTPQFGPVDPFAGRHHKQHHGRDHHHDRHFHYA